VPTSKGRGGRGTKGGRVGKGRAKGKGKAGKRGEGEGWKGNKI